MQLCSRRMTEQSDAKATKLKEELVNTKEALKKASLTHEVLSREKTELGTAMSAIIVLIIVVIVSVAHLD